MGRKIVSANVKSNPLMRQSSVEHDVKAALAAGEVILWQEIAPERYKTAVQKLGPSTEWAHYGISTEAPISLKKSEWRVLTSGTLETHAGRKFVTPSRYIVWVIAARVTNPDKIVVFMNTHYVSGAFSNHYPLTKKWRRVRWDYHYHIMDQMVEGFNKAGYTVIGGGDWNRGPTPKFTTGQRWLATGGIDHLFVSESDRGSKITLNSTEIISTKVLYTDHDFRIADIWVGEQEHPGGGAVPKFHFTPLAK